MKLTRYGRRYAKDTAADRNTHQHGNCVEQSDLAGKPFTPAVCLPRRFGFDQITRLPLQASSHPVADPADEAGSVSTQLRPFRLRSIQRKVRSFQHGARRIRPRHRNGTSDAGRNSPPVGKPAGRIDGHDALRGNAQRRARAPRMSERGRAIRNSSPPNLPKKPGSMTPHAHGVGNHFQYLIARRVPVLVVDLLEVIDIDDQDSARTPDPGRAASGSSRDRTERLFGTFVSSSVNAR